jgi:hypothetical protein
MQNEPRAPVVRWVLAVAGAVVVVLAAIVGGYVLLRTLPQNGLALEGPGDEPSQRPSGNGGKPNRPIQFAGWGQPDLVLVVSGQMHGFMDPCGCSDPQYGGLIRRQTLIDSLKAKGWDVIGIDLGELPAESGLQRQRELKLAYTMKALDLMGYRAVGLGKHEMKMPLIDALAQHSINDANPRPLASTLAGTERKKELYYEVNVRPYEIVGGDKLPKIGVLSLTGPGLEDLLKADKDLKFQNNKTVVLPKIHNAFIKEKVELAFLLHHEYPAGKFNPLEKEKARHEMAELCAKTWEAERKKNPAIPPLQLMMILSPDEPPSVLQPVAGTPTNIIEIGEKGKYVGVVGLYKKDGQIALKYQMVLMEESFKPKQGQKNKALEVMEEYTRQVWKEDLLKDYIRTPHPFQIEEVVKKLGGTAFAGSNACKGCHRKEYALWDASRHAKAFTTLEKATEPSLRQHDPECVVCHTVGFKHDGGWGELPLAVKKDLAQQKAAAGVILARLNDHNARLAHVGCESCHGPALVHVNNPNDDRLYPLINPYRPTGAEEKAANAMDNANNAQARQEAAAMAKKAFDQRMANLEKFCVKCHDEENDVTWSHDKEGRPVPFLTKWAGLKIVHNSPGNVGNRWLPPSAPAAKAATVDKKK